MDLTDGDLQEFMRIWQEEFYETISMDVARHSAAMLMELYSLLVQSLSNASLPLPEGSLPDHRT